MRDPLAWSLPLGTLFGISIRVHVLFPVVAIGLILRAATQPGAPPDIWIVAAGIMGLLFVSVFLHELGHCFAARRMEGDAHEVLLWPLGGLAYVDVPHTAWANFVVAAAGPAVNLLLCVLCGCALGYLGVRPPFSPFWEPYYGELYNWAGQPVEAVPAAMWVARFYYVNWLGALLNLALVGFPLDGGRILQAALWPRFGYRQAMVYAVFAGFITTLIVGIYAIAGESVLALFLAMFIYITCKHQYLLLEHGGEESVFGYDFSQGYTSLEREPPPRRKRPSFWQRWWQKRTQRRLQREQEQREAEERRMDELLEKVQRQGIHSLTDEERRFLTRVSAKYRNRP